MVISGAKRKNLTTPPTLLQLWGKDLGAKIWGTIFSHMAFFKLGGRGNPTIILTYPPYPLEKKDTIKNISYKQ